MNKIIWKNIDSSTIKGLMICELPPITKPAMRIQENTIDGVDGSTIEELGYESYDKSMTIGLYNDFNIDEVIEYFTGEGNVVFSNEPDKYYVARIVGQIDYARLLRFRQATINFRVQPFKYEYEENKNISIVSASDSYKVTNKGNYFAKPVMTIRGTGKITIKLNDNILFTYEFPDDDTEVVIDAQKQDAYLGSVLKNRHMTGDFPRFEIGENIITWEGTVESIEFSLVSRWL